MTNELVIVTNFVSRDITGLEVVNKVNELYSSVSNQQLILLSIIAGFAGVVLPITLQFYQRREGRIQEEKLNSEFKEQVAEAKNEFETKFKKLLEEQRKIESKLSDAEARISKQVARASGLAAHIDAANSYEAGKYYQSSRAAVFAVTEYSGSGDESNLLKVLGILIDSLKHLTKQQIEAEDIKNRVLIMEMQLKQYKGSEAVMQKIEEYFALKSAATKEKK